MSSDRKTAVQFLLLLLAWQVLLMFQGLDLADTGFHLTAYRYIIDAPYAVQYSMSFWLSELTGYIWMQIWPEGGLIWCRAGGIVFFTAVFMIYYRLLRQEMDARKAAMGLFVVAVFILKGGFECLNYDILSMLGYAVVTWCFYFGLRDEKNNYLFLGGLAMGVTLFFKLTNMAGLLFLLLIFFDGILKRNSLRMMIRSLGLSLSGLVTGIGLVLALIWILGHWQLYFDNLGFLFEIAGDQEASHGLLPLVLSYLKGFLNGFVVLVLFLAASWAFAKVPGTSVSISGKRVPWLVLIVVVPATFLLMVVFEAAFWSKIRYLLIGLIVITGVYDSINRKKKDSYRLLTMAGLILFLVAPMGSDSWPGKSLHGMWVLGTIAITQLDLKRLYFPLNLKIPKKKERMIKLSLVTAVLVSGMVYAWQNTYFDSGSRFLKRTPVDHVKMRAVYTSKERAEVMNELIAEAFPIIDQEYLLSFIEIPMVNYLASKKPFISTSWPKLYYSPESFREKLLEATGKRDVLPAIIRQKQNTGIAAWPAEEVDPDYLEYPEEMSRWPAHGSILNEFIAQYGYRTAWENEMFQLLIPAKESD